MPRPPFQFSTIYVRSISVALSSAVILKLLAASLSSPKLAQPDDLLWFFSQRLVLMLASLLELVVVLLLAKWRSQKRSFELILWLGAVFLLYHVFNSLVGGHNESHCNCFGGFLSRFENIASLGITAWMLSGSLVMLLKKATPQENS